MKCLLLLPAMALWGASGAGSLYQLSVRVTPAAVSSVTLFGTNSPFNASTEADAAGRCTFRKLEPGTYTIAVSNPGYGEVRRTIEVGPGTAGKSHRVSVALEFSQSDFTPSSPLRRHAVSARELAIPEKARGQFEEARKALTRRDADAAVKDLEQAVEAAPQFSAAWNQLGTIAYQTQKFDRAEECFRRALDADPRAYEPLVNLAGVLVTLHRTGEALEYNLRAVQARPHDALANSQLGLAYFEAGDDRRALEYLEIARRIDPAHFSHPQLTMAEIHARMGDTGAAAADLEDFLAHHPDWPAAARMRENIAQWKK